VVGKQTVVPRALMTKIFEEKFAGDEPDVTILRVEAHQKDRVASFTLVDRYDKGTKLTSMMRTTAWPASIVVQMLASGEIAKRGAIRQEVDVPADQFIAAMQERGLQIEYSVQTLEEAEATAQKKVFKAEA
jgi:saccharopine dehydrogenase-like NADP-dependent oxidoreductase